MTNTSGLRRTLPVVFLVIAWALLAQSCDVLPPLEGQLALPTAKPTVLAVEKDADIVPTRLPTAQKICIACKTNKFPIGYEYKQ